MGYWKIAWRSIQERKLASILTTLSMALAVLLMVSVLLVLGLVSESFRGNDRLGYNLVVGKKGGKLQLVLNSVYYLSQPIENIPYTYYQEFLSAEEQEKELAHMAPERRGNLERGKYSVYTEVAVPLALGDYYKKYRVIATLPKMFDELIIDTEKNSTYQFAQGRNFTIVSEEHGYFEAVIGRQVARETGLGLGDTFTTSHGPGEEAMQHGTAFHIVGILERTGGPIDRALYVNLEGFYLMEDHARPLEEVLAEEEEERPRNGDGSVDGTAAPLSDAESAPPDEHTASTTRELPPPLSVKQREVTAVLVKTRHAFVGQSIARQINKGPSAQAVFPIQEITALLQVFVYPLQRFLVGISILICVIAGVSILVSIYNSMSQRRHEIAVMRALGASRGAVFAIVLLESLFLALGGGLIGWLGGHLLVLSLNPILDAQTGVTIGLFDFVFAELLLVPGLMLLAAIVGFLPAVTAYRTDVAVALSANP